MLMRCIAQKSELPAIATTPLAEAQMQPQAKPLKKRQLAIKGIRLQAGGLLAVGRKRGDASEEGFTQVGEPVHFVAQRRINSIQGKSPARSAPKSQRRAAFCRRES